MKKILLGSLLIGLSLFAKSGEYMCKVKGTIHMGNEKQDINNEMVVYYIEEDNLISSGIGDFPNCKKEKELIYICENEFKEQIILDETNSNKVTVKYTNKTKGSSFIGTCQ